MGQLRVAILLGFWEKGLMFSGCLLHNYQIDTEESGVHVVAL